jgi:hypothetical protein
VLIVLPAGCRQRIGRKQNGGKGRMDDPLDIYAQFESARCEAVALTDHFRDLAPDDPRRTGAWDIAMEQTERARQLLEAWLRSEESGMYVSPLELVLA